MVAKHRPLHARLQTTAGDRRGAHVCDPLPELCAAQASVFSFHTNAYTMYFSPTAHTSRKAAQANFCTPVVYRPSVHSVHIVKVISQQIRAHATSEVRIIFCFAGRPSPSNHQHQPFNIQHSIIQHSTFNLQPSSIIKLELES